jgi:ABC-2 type transport system permease protein
LSAKRIGKEALEVPSEKQRNRSRLSQILAAVLVNSIYEMKNYPVVLINTVLSPLSFLILIVFVSKGSLIGVAIEGGLIMSMFSSGIGLQGDISHLKNDFKLQDMVVSSPTSWLTYMFGIALSEIVYSLPALTVLALLAYYYLALSAVGVFELLAVLLLMFLASMAIGFTLSTFSSDIVQSFRYITRLPISRCRSGIWHIFLQRRMPPNWHRTSLDS